MVKSTLVVKNLEEVPLREPRREGFWSKPLCGKGSAQNLNSGCVWMEPGAKIGMHSHTVEELQVTLYGSGVVRDCEGREHPLRAGTFFLCPADRDGAHEIENTGDFPMCLLFVYPTQDFETVRD